MKPTQIPSVLPGTMMKRLMNLALVTLALLSVNAHAATTQPRSPGVRYRFDFSLKGQPGVRATVSARALFTLHGAWSTGWNGERTRLVLHAGRVSDEVSFLRRKKPATMMTQLDVAHSHREALILYHVEGTELTSRHRPTDNERFDAAPSYLIYDAERPLQQSRLAPNDGQHTAGSGLRWGVSELAAIRFQAQLVYAHGAAGIDNNTAPMTGLEAITVPPVKSTAMSMRIGMDLLF